MEAIREHIRQGEWGPGHRLVESELTAEFGVSRGPLREAFGRLAAEGLITVQPHRGAMVSRLSPGDLTAIYQVREVLEGLAARLVAGRIDEPDVRKAVVERQQAMLRFSGELHRRDYFDENFRFHRALIDLGGNPHLVDATGRFGTQLYRYSMRALLDGASLNRSYKEHLAILDAILDGDEKKAERLMRAHVRTSQCAVLRVLDGAS
ncbi:GntR family transcriptional regulator [Mycolicibacterium lutetiense]